MVGFLEIRELELNYAQCRRYTQYYARSFYFASHVLPKAKRNAAYAVYAFCRYADEIVDHAAAQDDQVQARRRLSDLRNQLHYVYASSPQMSPKLLAFRDTVFRYRIPKEHFLDLLRGVEMDLHGTRFTTFEELKEYCYCVASVVGLMMTRIFGITESQALAYAADLGTAMQLTNIMRDIGEDYRRGRIYLPAEELQRFGYTEAELSQGIVNDRFITLMRFNIDRAREYYRRAEQGIPMLTDDGSRLCTMLMSSTYSRILDAIEQQRYDVFSTRAYVPTATKLRIMAGVLMRQLTTVGRRRSAGPSSTLAGCIPAELH